MYTLEYTFIMLSVQDVFDVLYSSSLILYPYRSLKNILSPRSVLFLLVVQMLQDVLLFYIYSVFRLFRSLGDHHREIVSLFSFSLHDFFFFCSLYFLLSCCIFPLNVRCCTRYKFVQAPVMALPGTVFTLREVKIVPKAPTVDEIHDFIKTLFSKACLSSECSLVSKRRLEHASLKRNSKKSEK